MRSGRGRLGVAGHLDARLHDQRHPILHVGLVGAEVDSEGAVRPLLHLVDRPLQLVEGHGPAGEDPEAAGLAGGRGQPRPRHPAHAGLHDRMADADQLAEPGVRAPRSLHLAPAQPRRVEHARGRAAAPRRVGRRVSARSLGDDEGKPVASTTSSTVTRDAPSAAACEWSGVSKSRTALLVTTTPDLVEARSRTAASRRARRSRRPTPRRPARRRRAGVVGHPVARGVVDGVAGRAAHAEELGLRAGPSRRCRRCSGCRSGRSGWRPSSRGAARTRATSNTVRYGSQPSITLCSGGRPTGSGLATT